MGSEVKVDLAANGCKGIEGQNKICSSQIDTAEECLLGEGWPLVCPKIGSLGKQFVQVGLASPVFDCVNRKNLMKKLGGIKNVFQRTINRDLDINIKRSGFRRMHSTFEEVSLVGVSLSVSINTVFTDVTDTSCFMEWAQNCPFNTSGDRSQGCHNWAGKQFCRAKTELMAFNNKEKLDSHECDRMEALIKFNRDFEDNFCQSVPDCTQMEEPKVLRKVVKKRKDGRS